MIDIVDQKTRSRMMSGIRGQNTKPELALRRALHCRGWRFRLHPVDLFGKPDIVIQKYRVAIFVHGCFWHRHQGCRYASSPSTRPEFWTSKFEANVSRDIVVRTTLLKSGWRVATVWECALRNPNQVDTSSEHLTEWLRSGGAQIEIGLPNVE